ncbi:hypothetical protein ACIPV2_07790 [Microbacterium sp. NPDC089987]|uniref:hypothetical protein n=1 Tax=Microbacterium sp. NPDC089987 TaxID=3364202 RepID=UPI0038091DAC
MGSSETLRKRLMLLTVPTLGLALALSGCAPASPPSPTPSADVELFSAEDGVRSSVNLFFALLAAGDEEGAAEELYPAVDFEQPLALLLTRTEGVYNLIEDRPKILSVDDVTAADDAESGSATVTYEMAGAEHTDTVDLRRTSEDELGSDDYAMVIPEDAFGLDASGVERLPADTVYRIHGVDVSEAFLAARALADGGEVPRIPALGGTYPLEIAVPGANGFTGTVTLQMSGVLDGTGTDGVLSAFVGQHGF